MLSFTRGCVVLLLVSAACRGKDPATAPSPPPNATFSLSGTVTNLATSTRVSGATASIADGPNAGKSTTTDASGNYSFTGLQQSAFTVNVSATNYVSQSWRVTLTSNQTLNFRLTPVPPTSTFHVTGIATDDDGAPVVGATVTVTPDPRHSSVSTVTDWRGSYNVDFDATHTAPNVFFAYVKAESPGHESFFDYLPGPDAQSISITKNLHLYRLKRISAGESTVVTVVPGDTNCGYDDELTCRTVRVVVPTDGLLTMSCDPQGDDNGGPGLTIVGYNGRGSSGLPRHFVAGEWPVDIGMWFQSSVSQSCVFKTSLARPEPTAGITTLTAFYLPPRDGMSVAPSERIVTPRVAVGGATARRQSAANVGATRRRRMNARMAPASIAELHRKLNQSRIVAGRNDPSEIPRVDHSTGI
jgi:hypothetical protein